MISIIIIVKNDRGIINTLNALGKIYKPIPTEIIVVDASNGSLDDIKSKFPNIQWIHFKNNKKKTVTIPEQRNVGIKASKGNIVIFIDANCIPERDWFIELIKPAFKDNECIIAGNVRALNTNTVNTITSEIRKDEYLKEAATVNLLINKLVFKKIGYFDESGTYGEDIDLTWRAIDAGFKIKSIPKAIVGHDYGNFQEQIRRMIRYGSVRIYLYRKHPNRFKEVIIGNNTTALIYPLFLLFLPLTFVFPFYPLVLLIPIFKNIKHKPIQVTVLNLFYGIGIIKGFINSLI